VVLSSGHRDGTSDDATATTNKRRGGADCGGSWCCHDGHIRLFPHAAHCQCPCSPPRYKDGTGVPVKLSGHSSHRHNLEDAGGSCFWPRTPNTVGCFCTLPVGMLFIFVWDAAQGWVFLVLRRPCKCLGFFELS
jgi:hypothetical protein